VLIVDTETMKTMLSANYSQNTSNITKTKEPGELNVSRLDVSRAEKELEWEAEGEG